MKDPIVVVIDVKQMRPGCALLQAVMGGSQGIANAFDNDDWLLSPTPDMKPYRVKDKEELRKIVKLVESRRPKGGYRRDSE